VLWQFKTDSGIIGQPTTFRGPDGHQYVAILSGVGGWAGVIVSAGLDPRDGSAALGFVNAMRIYRSTPRRGERSMSSVCPEPRKAAARLCAGHAAPGHQAKSLSSDRRRPLLFGGRDDMAVRPPESSMPYVQPGSDNIPESARRPE
jgi:hypothetical protein